MDNDSNKLPKVLVGGFPNSGTSFVCNLIVSLGNSPGKEESLKNPDSHNRWGYFEHLPIRQIVWKTAGFDKFQPDQPGLLPTNPLPLDERVRKNSLEIAEIAEKQNVEVYKDNALPLVYKLFNPNSKYIITERNINAIYQSPIKAGMSGYKCSVSELEERYQKYMHLAKFYMRKDVDCLFLPYEDFKSDFKSTVLKLASHLNVHLDDDLYASCKEAFKPRKPKTLKGKLKSLLRKDD